jgi:hypothetical protein
MAEGPRPAAADDVKVRVRCEPGGSGGLHGGGRALERLRCSEVPSDGISARATNATLIAAAANVAAAGLASRAGRPIGFMSFLRVGVPVTVVSMLLATAYIALRYL